METQTPPTPTPTAPQGSPNSTLMAVLSYIGILVVIPLLTAKDDQFVKFHAKQGLVLFICEVVGWAILAVPFLGWTLWPILQLAFLVMVVIGIMNVIKHETKELPLIGHLASNFKF